MVNKLGSGASFGILKNAGRSAVDMSNTAVQLVHKLAGQPLVVRVLAVLTAPAVVGVIRPKLVQAAWDGMVSVLRRSWRKIRPQSQSKRRPIDLRLVLINPLGCMWGVGAKANTPTMTLHFRMNFAHAEKNLSVIVQRAYLKGTQPVITMPIVVEGPHDEPQQIHLTVTPIKAKTGKKLKGKIVFVDQFNDSHVSETITFFPNPHRIQLMGTPHCLFCGKPIESGDQAPEAQVPAHTSCVWP
jgi:hypothetical protein